MKKFLAAPHKTGVDVKKKLVWLAQKSYLFRFLCQEYLEKEDSLRAFQLLKWKDTIPYVQYQYSDMDWKKIADLYQKYALEDTSYETRKDFCLQKANIQIEKNE